ncbi:MAG: hypothetical protein RL205_1109 [Actinomycetota bacterium]
MYLEPDRFIVHSAKDLGALLAQARFTCPDGVDLRETEFGLGLFATRNFAPGEAIYRCGWFTVEDVEHRFHTTIDGASGTHQVEITTEHSVRFDGTRIFDIPGCFMNHDCRGNSIPRYAEDDSRAYEEIATVAISAGEQITCNYLLFDWECDGHTFTCQCGHPQCFGEIRGFAHLSPAQQESLAADITDEVLLRWREHGRESTR